MTQNTDLQSNKPVIFLAFANDRVEGGAYLRNLPVELEGIRPELRDKKYGRPSFAEANLLSFA
jgi:hypothetical protein